MYSKSINIIIEKKVFYVFPFSLQKLEYFCSEVIAVILVHSSLCAIHHKETYVKSTIREGVTGGNN